MALTTVQVVDRAKQQLSRLIDRKPSGVMSVSKDDRGWHVSLEMLEKKSIPDGMDLLAKYEVVLDEAGNILKFDRRDLRTRSEATKHEEE